jgi:DNA-binding response OmpR family regulator
MKKKLIIVDDEAMLASMLTDFFSMLNYDVHCALDWEAASELMHDHEYDAIVLDLRLSGGSMEDGLKNVQEARERYPMAWMILQTGYKNDEVQTEARRLGADVVLEKPVQLQRLRNLLVELEMLSAARMQGHVVQEVASVGAIV